MKYMSHEVAKKVNLTVPTLHYYEKAGLLPPIERDAIGNRIYTEKDIEWIYMIARLRECDLPIRDIKNYVELLLKGPSTMSQRFILVQRYKENVQSKINALEESLQLLEAKSNFYQDVLHSVEEIPCTNYFEEWDLFKERIAGTKK